jgi:hypothetical protein
MIYGLSKTLMGVLWTVWPLDNEMRQWLDETGVPYPAKASRFPTGAEIKAALDDLTEHQVEITDNGIGGSWQAFVTHKCGPDEHEWTLLNVSEFSGDEHPQKLWFEKGWPSLIVLILERLTPKSGPLVLIPDTGETPSVIDS